MGQGPTGGGSALMPKGEKPKGPQLLPVAEVARRLRVQPSQVENWLEKGQLRGDSQGVRPYDFKKFQLDNPELIQRAKQEAVQEKTTQGKRKPKKGLLSKFKSLFGGGSDTDVSDATLAKENKRLKAQLSQLQKNKKPGSGKKDEGTDLEEKVRYLEGKLSETRALESEVMTLKKQLSEQRSTPSLSGDASGQELEEMRAQLAEAQRQSKQGERFREALTLAQQERDELMTTIQELKQQQGSAHDGTPDASNAAVLALQASLAQSEHALSEAKQRIHQVLTENEQLRHSAQQPSQPEAPPQDNALIDELLNLQRVNLKRFKRLRSFYEEELQQPQAKADSAELQALRDKYEALVAKQGSGAETDEMMEQLSQSRLFISRLKEENGQLKEQLQNTQQSDSRVQELEQKLQAALLSGAEYQQAEAELKSLRKAMEAKENQIQKVSSRLSDNEKRLSKAMGESARLTELLIERENRLRELSEEFEQEYRDKLENLDRQVSGLQWKLSLREERISHLEGELQRKG
jgi:DNA repair exonuclease SbcCD ATPase subunit